MLEVNKREEKENGGWIRASSKLSKLTSNKLGADSRRDTPVPISNTEVKSPSGNGTNLVTNWESSTVPDNQVG